MTNPGHTLVIDVDRSRQWGEELLLIVADPDDEGVRDRVLMRPHYCQDPRCQCTEVRLAFTKLDAHVERVHEYADEVELELDSGDRVRPTLEFESPCVWLDLLSGRAGTLFSEDDEPDDDTWAAEDAELTAEFGQVFDGETLDELWRRQGLARGVETSKLTRQLPTEYRRGQAYAWEEVCKGARRDVYLRGDDTVVVYDYYCPAPSCDCNDARVAFVSQPADRRLGFVSVEFETGKLRFEADEKRFEQDLRGVWNDYVQRWPGYCERLRTRYLALREALHDVVIERADSFERPSQPRRRKGAKIGRNQPCPCGSGRKYKRCCGAA